MRVEAVWREVTDELVAGVAHDLSDRISALAGIAHILALDHAGEPLVEMLGSEVARLEEVLQLLRAYPRGEGGARTALALADVVPPLARLYERRVNTTDPAADMQGVDLG
ncbi:MAG: HAMP domain-containing histidine kinase, partial [Gemmatimonadetes bacterium]|nr:HAMP domain-containing histidine kinase [Gemmatimonadota bacterium]